MIDYFNIWNGFSLFCPDIKPGDPEFYMIGDSSENISSKYSFKIDYCSNDTAPVGITCKTREEIDDKISQVQLDTW